MQQAMTVSKYPLMSAKGVAVHYGKAKAISNVSLEINSHAVFALVGPSGCGKSTLLRCFNRMNDFIEGFQLSGSVKYKQHEIYANSVDPAWVRSLVGMVFQKPNPFPSSIRKNILWGPKINGMVFEDDELLETSLRKAALWDEVKDRLNNSGLSLSGGQQQRLCIARAIAMEPEVILMDEPCASLDPVSAKKIEELIIELKEKFAIVIVTHNMQQATRVSDYTGFMYQGELVEFNDTKSLFSSPKNKLTADYVNGHFG